MTDTTKGMPFLLKMFLGLAVIGAFGQLLTLANHRGSPSYSPQEVGLDAGGELRSRPAAAAVGPDRRLAQFQALQRELQAQMTQCRTQINQAINQVALAAMQGQATTGRPSCEPYMQIWIAQEAVAETNIYRIQTGKYDATVLEVTGVRVSPGASASLVSSRENQDPE